MVASNQLTGVARNPIFLFLIAPFLLFVVKYRFVSAGSRPRERRSVHLANLAIACLVCIAGMTLGFRTYLYFQTLILLVAGSVGVWLFYVQHQFEGVVWERTGLWTPPDAALLGSSYYRLPKVLQWFTGNIGFHHVHHHNPGIPNYHLERMHRSSPMFLKTPVVTFWSSLRSARLRLWDENARRLVGYPARQATSPPHARTRWSSRR